MTPGMKGVLLLLACGTTSVDCGLISLGAAARLKPPVQGSRPLSTLRSIVDSETPEYTFTFPSLYI